ncbi:MAG: aminofutalosine synthase MqnE [Euryarchaeota archaeon]|nr:aminofutalosine synthase MqnE [Euryarchaeota archaeon]
MELETVLKEFRGDEVYDIGEKALAGEELTRKDGMALMQSKNLLLLGAIADRLRAQRVGDLVTFVVNRHINYSNVCISGCKFCAFYRKPNEEGAYTMSMEEILGRVEESVRLGITELHIVGSLNPDLPFEFYEKMLREIKTRYPRIHIQAFTAAEIAYFAKIAGSSVKEVLERLMGAGLDSMPGGGAEIFDEQLRKELCPNKVSGEGWLDVMATAHRLGMKTNATMLYGHVETLENRVDHILRLREAQRETGGFQAFIPLSFHPQNTRLLREGRVSKGPTGFDDLRTLAVSRILLHGTIDNIRAFWIMLGKKLAQISLTYGVNDLDGTVVEERITHAAGATTEEYISRDELIALIREVGRVPAQRTTTHEIVQVFRD